MRFDPELIPATLVRRYKRFLADVTMGEGTGVTAHCPNTGSMLGCQEPGSRVWLSLSDNPKRKYCHTWELVETATGALVGINTGRSNRLVREAIESGTMDELAGYASIRAEVRYGVEGSRVDFLLEDGDDRRRCYVEVKNVTAAVDKGVAIFPDAVSVRGTRHLRELENAVASDGQRAVLCFCVQRADVREVRPADDIDSVYGEALRSAIAAGVEAIAYRAAVSAEGIQLMERIPVVCP
jgi:sugar fermentation stimulation protein A